MDWKAGVVLASLACAPSVVDVGLAWLRDRAKTKRARRDADREIAAIRASRPG
jgi:hypothetical protein